MTYSPPHGEPIPALVSEWTSGWGLMSEGVSITPPASAAWESSNRGVWFPVWVPSMCVARRAWWANGTSVSASYNVEAGLYLDAGYKPGQKLVTTGSIAQGTASQVQFADITDTTLTPGLFWMFMSCSTASATFFRATINDSAHQGLLRFNQYSIGPGSAPTTATPAVSTSQNIYLFGIATTASP